MSYFDGDGVDWNHPSLTQFSQPQPKPANTNPPRSSLPPSNAAAVAAASSRSTANHQIPRGGIAHPPPNANANTRPNGSLGFMGGMGGNTNTNANRSTSSTNSYSSGAAVGGPNRPMTSNSGGGGMDFMSRARSLPQSTPVSNSGSSLPPPPDWSARAANAPASSPLATYQQRPTNTPSSTTGSSPHFPPGRTGSNSNNSFGSNPPQRQPSGVKFTNGTSSSNSSSFSGSQYSRPPQPFIPPPPPVNNNNSRGQSWDRPRAVAFPTNFNPNNAPSSIPPFVPPSSAVNYRPGQQSQPPQSKFRTTFAAPDTDVPRGRKLPKSSKLDLGQPLPEYLQPFVHVQRGKLPDHLTSDDRRLLKAERKRLKEHDKLSKKELADSKKAAEVIDLDVYRSEQNRERGGWNSSRIKVAFQLCSAERVAIETTPRNEMTILHVIQTVEGAVFDKSLASLHSGTKTSRRSDEGGMKGLWTIPIKSYHDCIARCIGLRTDRRDVVIVPVDSKHLDKLRNTTDTTKFQMKFESMQGIPPALAQQLYPFQKEGVEYCVNHGGRAMIGDEMGLGKTLQAISVAAYYQDDWPLLVVCPSSVRLTWKNELLKWLGKSSLQESDFLTLSSDDEADDPMEGFIPDDDDDVVIEDVEGESQWQPSTKERFQDDFIEDDEEFERILKATATKSAATSKSTSKSPAANSDGEAEYDLTKSKSKSSSTKGRKRSRLDSDEDPSEEDEDDEWNPDEEEAELLKAEEDALEEDEEEYVPIKKKKTANKRRKIVSDDEEESSPEVEEDELIPPSDQDEEEEAPIVTPSKKSRSPPTNSGLSGKAAFLAAHPDLSSHAKPISLKEQFEKVSPTATKKVSNGVDEEDEELQESLRLIAEMEEREKLLKQQSTSVKLEPSASIAVKSESISGGVKVENAEVVNLIDDDEDLTVKSEPIKSEPLPIKTEDRPYVSASSLIAPVTSEFDVKKESTTPVLPTVKSQPPATTSTTLPTSSKSATPVPPARAPSTDFPAFVPPVKAPVRPAFRALFKNEINVILNGRTPLMGHASSACRVVIISYDLVAKYVLALQRQNFKFIICDESHYVKNSTAKRSQALLPLLERAKRVLCLSGTPAMSRPFELYPQINALYPGVFGSAAQFGARYCAPTKGWRGIEYKGANNLVELHMLLKKYLLIRRLKSDVLKDLRPKTRTVILTTVHDRGMAEKMKKITNLKQVVSNEIQAGEKPAGPALKLSSSSDIMSLYSDTGVAKLPFVLSYLADLVEAGTKFLVFAHHLAVLNGIEEFLKKQKDCDYFRIDGSTSPGERQAGVERFQSDPACRVALLSITAGGTGITLTAASTVVFAELQWTPALLRQAEDRVHRIGQFNPVNIYYIIANHTLDDVLWPMLSNKLEVLGGALDGRADALDVHSKEGDQHAIRNTALQFKMAPTTFDLTHDDPNDIEMEEEKKQLTTSSPPIQEDLKLGKSNWIGMSNGRPKQSPSSTSARVTPPAAATSAPLSIRPELLEPITPLKSFMSTSVAAIDPDLDGDISFTQIRSDLNRESQAQRRRGLEKLGQQTKKAIQAELDQFRVPSPQPHQDEDEEDGMDELMSPPAVLNSHSLPRIPEPDSVMDLQMASDEDYASDEEEEEEVTGMSVREALERGRAQRAAKQQ